jgi:hypothetical protein
MTCDDSCAVDKAEAKEFAYFSGLTKGAHLEQERIIRLLKENATCDFEQQGGAHSNNACYCWYLKAIKLITGENK